ncbi:right-handed parallel beta-helix repeat-containing protein [Halomonas cerina]|uniref:Right handed beta helix domain-containing protein n=1 Tax=Halomonas cerina TaxID=447424 RepID=A0A839V6G7_9GAMM|nr:right-handed parallel beta-helix repeat-containing protein [Halomonas cerina]MBB3189395.1 hypothetical protein [Halomonas cerina]
MSLSSLTDDEKALSGSMTAGSTLLASNRQAATASSGAAPTPRGIEVTTSQMGVRPSGDPVTDHRQLQAFLDSIATDGVAGLIEAGHWYVHKKLILHDGTRLRGRGMGRTTLEARPADWQQPDYVLLHLDVDRSLHRHGVFLSDFGVIGADKQATDNGPLLRLEGMSDFLLERLQVEDASSYGIFVTGYGVGTFTNDIDAPFWNSTHRGTIRQCRALRGQVGIGCEGGAQNVLIMGNHTSGQTLHGFRLASAYETQLVANSARDTRNAYWVDRHRGVHVLYNTARKVEQGCVYGGFHDQKDGEISKGLWIMGNEFDTTDTAITDAYHGDANKFTNDVKIKDNMLSGGNVRLLWTRKVDVQGNSGDGRNVIRTSHHVTGMIGNNLMPLYNTATGVIDIGNNLDPGGM